VSLLPGATTTDPLGWTQPVSWVAAYSSKTWTSFETAHRFGNYTMLADGAATSTALRGEGRPSTVANGLWGPSDRMVVTWNLALGRTK
jgi:hypothetical protein